MPYNNPFPGAAWTRVSYFAQHFKKEGHDITIIGGFLSYRLYRPSSRTWKNIRIYNICPVFGLDRFFTFIIDIIMSFLFLLPYCIKAQPDVVILSSPYTGPCIGLWAATKLMGIKTVVDLRDLSIEYNLLTFRSPIDGFSLNTYRKLFTGVLRKSDVVVTVTEGLINYLKTRRVDGVYLISNGADTNVFKPYDKNMIRQKYDLNQDDFILVFVGGAVTYYSVTDILDAMSKLESEIKQKIKLLLVGDFGTYAGKLWLSRLEEKIERYKLQQSVIHLGSVEDKVELAKIISCGDVGVGTLLMTGHNRLMIDTALPTKFFEYSACELPIISTAHSRSLITKMINKYQIGIVNKIHDQYGILESIRSMYYDKDLREKMGKNGRRMVVENFDREQQAKKLLEVCL